MRYPPIHLIASEAFWFADQCSEDHGVGDSGFPQMFRQLMVFADSAGKPSQIGHRNPEPPFA
jgi:hypothetical protein